jgi:Type VI secretion system VasI, EvfG, VC_A0118
MKVFSMSIARTGAWTIVLLLTLALGVSAQAATAAEPNCRAIESTAARLACYDAVFPPKAKKAADANADSRPAYKDPFAEEEARTTAKLRNICRGC